MKALATSALSGELGGIVVVRSGWKNPLVIQIALKKVTYGWRKSQKSGSVREVSGSHGVSVKEGIWDSWWKGSPEQSEDLATQECCGACEETE